MDPMNLDDNVASDQAEVQLRDVDGIPYCARHHCRMKLASGAGKRTGKDYFRCPVPSCSERGTRIRTKVERIVPDNPQSCPRCSNGATQVFCEASKDRSNPAAIVLVCPNCGFSPGMFVRPQLEAVRIQESSRLRRSVPNIGDR